MGKFNVHGDMRIYGLSVVHRTATAVDQMEAEESMTLVHLTAKLVARKKKMEKSEIRYSRGGCPNPVHSSSSKRGG